MQRVCNAFNRADEITILFEGCFDKLKAGGESALREYAANLRQRIGTELGTGVDCITVGPGDLFPGSVGAKVKVAGTETHTASSLAPLLNSAAVRSASTSRF